MGKKTAKQQAAEDRAATSMDRQLSRALVREVPFSLCNIKNPSGNWVVEIKVWPKTPGRRSKPLTFHVAAEAIVGCLLDGVTAYQLGQLLTAAGVPQTPQAKAQD